MSNAEVEAAKAMMYRWLDTPDGLLFMWNAILKIQGESPLDRPLTEDEIWELQTMRRLVEAKSA